MGHIDVENCDADRSVTRLIRDREWSRWTLINEPLDRDQIPVPSNQYPVSVAYSTDQWHSEDDINSSFR